MSKKIEAYAEFFFQLRQTGEIADDIPHAFTSMSMADAYKVQDLLVDKLTTFGETRTFGYKIGCTSVGAQQLLNTDAPVYGQMLMTGYHQSPTTLKADDFTMIVIEPEFAFSLNDDVPAGHYDARTIRPFVADVRPSIEIVHHRLGAWDRFDAVKLIADNAIHGTWIAGDTTAKWQEIDFPQHEVHLYSNDRHVESGRGEIALGNPLTALAWIANTLPEYGRQLKAGEWVTTGVCMNIYVARAGETIRADFGTLGDVVLTLE